MIANVCPYCGTDIRIDAPIILNDFSMYGDGYPLMHKGKPVRLTPRENAVCWALMKAYPHHISKDALLNHIGSEDAECNVLEVYITRIRRKLTELRIPDPIARVRGVGLRWKSAAEMEGDDEVVAKASKG